MIDGVKSLCGINPKDWTDNKNLSFFSRVNTSTGEMPNNNKYTDINGLCLSITEKEKNIYCNIRGSLPKYYTNGETNAIDYHFSDFITTLEQLETELNIIPENAVLQNIEFGVNIQLPFDISNIYESLKSYKGQIFGINKIHGKTNGVSVELQQYKIKIYDKGLQETGKKSRLMRFEIAVNKMEKLKHLEIKSIADLKNISIWFEFTQILLKVWEDMIFMDKESINYRLLSEYQQKKFLRFLDAHYWGNSNRNTYHKSKNYFYDLQTKFGTGENKKDLIYNLIAEKCKKLTTANMSTIGDKLTDFLPIAETLQTAKNNQPQKTANWRQINSLDKGLETVTNSHTFFNINHPTKHLKNSITGIGIKKPKSCKCCRKKMLGKKATALFCSVKCKNKYHQTKKSQKNKISRKKEMQNLERIMQNIPKKKYWLSVTYKTNEGDFTDILRQCEIIPKNDVIRQIKAVCVSSKYDFKAMVSLTTVRAKILIRSIAKYNESLDKRQNSNELTDRAGTEPENKKHY